MKVVVWVARKVAPSGWPVSASSPLGTSSAMRGPGWAFRVWIQLA